MREKTGGTVTDFLAEQPDPSFGPAATDLRKRLDELTNALYQNPSMNPEICRMFWLDFAKAWIDQHTEVGK